MKVAVCFSGQLRDDYHSSIERVRSIIPNADFFFTTWTGQPQENFINRYYTPPDRHIHYPQRRSFIAQKAGLQKIIDSDFDPDIIPSSLRHLPKEKIIPHHDGLFKDFEFKASHNWQHIAHALTVKDFVDQSKYDIIIRCRYDVVVYRELAAHIKNFCEQVYENKSPYGFCCFNYKQTVDGFITPPKMIKQNVSRDCNDFMIIHRADMYDPNLVFFLHEQDALRNAEGGWYQTLCQPYGLFATTVYGFVRMTQQHDDQQKYFEMLKEDPTGPLSKQFPETMGMQADDVEGV